MEKPPHLIRVSTANQTDHWDLEKDLVLQMGVLVHQIEDGYPEVILPGGVGPKRFEKILRLFKSPLRAKDTLKACTSKQLVQLAKTADCLGTAQLLSDTMDVLQKRIGDDNIPDLPETLQQDLVERVVQNSPYIKLLLSKGGPEKPEEKIKEPPRLILKKNHFIFPNTQSFSDRMRAYNENDEWFEHTYSFDECVLLNDSNLFFYDEIKQKVYAAWSLKGTRNALIVHKDGFICTFRDNPNLDHSLFFYDIGNDEPRVFVPFKTLPTALAFHVEYQELVAGSADGQVGIFNIHNPRHDIFILGPWYSTRLDRDGIEAIAIDHRKKYIAVGDQNKMLGLWTLKKKKYELLACLGSKIEGLQFNGIGDLLFVAIRHQGVNIWSVDLKRSLIHIKTSDLPSQLRTLRKTFNLTINTDDTQLKISNEWESKIIPLLPVELRKSVMNLPLPLVEFLVRAGRKICEGKQISFDDEKDLKQMYRSLPPSLQKTIVQYISWWDWMWL